jgi:hypothetical protein
LLAHFGHAPRPVLPPASQELHKDAKAMLHDLREGDVRITVATKNRRAQEALRRLEHHARR